MLICAVTQQKVLDNEEHADFHLQFVYKVSPVFFFCFFFFSFFFMLHLCVC